MPIQNAEKALCHKSFMVRQELSAPYFSAIREFVHYLGADRSWQSVDVEFALNTDFGLR